MKDKIIETANTDEKGNYKLNHSKKMYSITFKKDGYIEIDFLIKDLILKNITTIILNEDVNELEEVIIQADRPITIKKDTVVFDVKAFAQGNEQVVEDLLKKIPGLQIDEKGTIKVGNQEIEKIMIDGDDMFEKGYKILSKNMPVNPLEKIELLQNYSNNRHLKGIENSNKVALNLKLKEDAKRVWFGNVHAGYGLVSENRYDARSNLMNFGKKNKYYFLTNLNNIGNNAVGEINHLIRPFRTNEPASLGDDQSVNSLLSLGYQTPNLQQKRTLLNNAEMLSLNSIFTLSNKVKLKSLVFINTDEVSFFRNSIQKFSAQNTSFINTEDFNGKKKQFTSFGKLDFIYEIAQNKTLEFITKFNKTKDKDRSSLLFNTELLNEKLNSDNQFFDQKLVFTNKINTNKVFLLSARYINEKTPQNYTVNQFIYPELFSENANNVRQFSENKMQFSGIEAHLLNRTNTNHLFELKIGNQIRIDKLNTKFELLNNQTTLAYPNQYQNLITYSTNNLYTSALYRINFKKLAITTQANVQQLFNKIEHGNDKSKQNPLLIIPKVGLDWQINNKNKIITSYTYNTTNAGVLDIYSGYVLTSFRSFEKGLQNFNQLNASNAVVNYTYGNFGDKFFANTMLIFTKNNNFYSTNSIISQNYAQSQKILIKDREFLTFSSSIDKYIKPLKNNIKFNFGGTKTNFKNIVNNSDLREVKNLNAFYGFEVRSGFLGSFNYHFGTKWNYNKVKTNVENNFTDNISFLDLTLILNEKLSIEAQTERYYFGNLNKNSNTYYFLDIESRYIFKENKLTFFISANNLFNTKKFRNYNITDIAISETEYQLMPRYVLLKLEYRF